MEAKTLIFKISLSPQVFNTINDIYSTFHNCHNAAMCYSHHNLSFNIYTYYGIEKDLREILINSQDTKYSFNAYILMMVVNKIESLLNSLTVNTGKSGHELAIVLHDAKDQLSTILHQLLEAN